MTIYQIIRTQIINGGSSCPKFKSSVIDYATNEEDAVRLLKSYQQSQTEDESYQIKTVRANLKLCKW